MTLEPGFAFYFWGFLGVYGVAVFVITPWANTVGSFYRGTDTAGHQVSQWTLTTSIFISCIFAKSITNVANLGAAYGIVGERL